MRTKTTLLFVAASFLLHACTDTSDDAEATDSLDTARTALEEGVVGGVAFSAAQQVAVLDLVNNASLEVLDKEVPLRVTAARNIVDARPIESLAALDAVPYVGPASLQALKDYLPTWTGEAERDRALLEFVNHPSVTFDELNGIRYVGPLHAEGIIAYRKLSPISSFDEFLAATASAGANPLSEWGVKSVRDYVEGWRAPDTDDGEGHQPGTWHGIAFSGYEVGLVLDIVNNAAFEILNDEVPLDVRAATNIVNNRPIESMDALDAIPWVATQAFQRLKAWLPNWTPGEPGEQDPPSEPPPGEAQEVSGVSFTPEEAEVVLDMANRASQSLLDDEVRLDTRAAANIVAARPIETLQALDAIPYVAFTAFTRMKEFIPTWQSEHAHLEPEPSGGTYNGVEFTAAEEALALEIANLATATQLNEGGLAPTQRNILLANRPWNSLAAVANFSGIGPATMASLHSMVPGWEGPAE